MKNLLALVLLLASSWAARAASPTDAIQMWVGAEYLFTGKLTQVQYGPVGLSQPPVYSTRLTLVVDQVMRGPLKKGQQVLLNHSIRQNDRPVFPEGQLCLVKTLDVEEVIIFILILNFALLREVVILLKMN